MPVENGLAEVWYRVKVIRRLGIVYGVFFRQKFHGVSPRGLKIQEVEAKVEPDHVDARVGVTQATIRGVLSTQRHSERLLPAEGRPYRNRGRKVKVAAEIPVIEFGSADKRRAKTEIDEGGVTDERKAPDWPKRYKCLVGATARYRSERKFEMS